MKRRAAFVIPPALVILIQARFGGAVFQE